MADGESLALELSGLAKRIYTKKKIEKIVQTIAVTYDKLPKAADKLGGAGIYGGTIYQGNEAGQGSMNEYEALRTPDRQEVAQWNVQPTVFTHTIMISGLAMSMLEGNEESFANSWTMQMERGLEDAAKELNAQTFRNGSGKIGTCAVVTTSATVTITSGIITHFRVGMLLDAYLSGTTTLERAGLKVIAVDYAAYTITLSATTSLTASDDLYRSAVLTNAPTGGKELSGFPRVIDDGSAVATYEGITRLGSGFVWAWKGLELDASQANLSDDFLQRMYMTMFSYSGKKPNTIRINTTQARKYMALTLPQVRFDEKAERDTAPSGDNAERRIWNGIEMLIDLDCGFDEVYMWASDYIYKFENRPLSFDSSDGNIIKWNPGFDAYIGFAKTYANIGTDVPRAMIHGKNLKYSF